MALLRIWLLQYITRCLPKVGRSRLDLLRSLILYNPFSCPYLSFALPQSFIATLLWGEEADLLLVLVQSVPSAAFAQIVPVKQIE